MTDAQLNENIKLLPYDRLVRATLLWMFPERWGIRPNHITVARFIGAPVVFWFLWEGWYGVGLILFLLVSLTDAIDGAMARTRHQITAWGTTYDSVADKFLISGAVLMLVLQHLDGRLVAAVIMLEVISGVGALYFRWRRAIVRPALWWGKIKMNCQVFGTAFLLMSIIWDMPALLAASTWVFGISLILGVINIFAQARIGWR